MEIYEYFVDALSLSPIEFGTKAHPFKSLSLVMMEIHNELSFKSKTKVLINLKENARYFLTKGSVRFIEMHSVEINVYSSDSTKKTNNMKRPEIIFTDQANKFSTNTYFSIYETYLMKKDIQHRLSGSQAVYDDSNVEILLDHTSLSIKNIIFKGKPSLV